MIVSFIENIVLGFAISAVPGAVFFETIRRGLLSFSSVLSFLAGNFTGMVIVICSSFLGAAFLVSNLMVSSLFYVVSGSVLLYLGISAIKQNKKDFEKVRDSTSQLRFAYLAGIILSVANPLSFLFWISLNGKFLEQQLSAYQSVINSFAVLLGAILLFTLLLVIVKFSSKRLTEKYLVTASRLFGIIITSYGFMTLLTAFRQI